MLTNLPVADQLCSEYLTLPQFGIVLCQNFTLVQLIFTTKFCPGLGLFLISLREKNALCSPGAAPGYFVLKFAPGPVYF